jgi:hypothetical protein
VVLNGKAQLNKKGGKSKQTASMVKLKVPKQQPASTEDRYE